MAGRIHFLKVFRMSNQTQHPVNEVIHQGTPSLNIAVFQEVMIEISVKLFRREESPR